MSTFQPNQIKEDQQPQTLVQPSLEIGEEDDEQEKEANSVADKVMRMSEPADEKKKPMSGEKIQCMTDTSSEKLGRMHAGKAEIRKMSVVSETGITASKNVEEKQVEPHPQDSPKKEKGEKQIDPVKIGNSDKAVHWYLPFGERIAQWGYDADVAHTNVDIETQKNYTGPWTRNALDNGLFSAVQGLVTELVLKRLGLEGMKSKAAGAGVAIATGAAGLEIKERIRCKTIESYSWYGRYRYNPSDGKVLAVDFWGKGPSFLNMVKPVILEQCIMNAKGEVLYTYSFELKVGVNIDNADYIPTHSFGKIE